MAKLTPTNLETADYGTVGWNAIYSSNFQKINDYLKRFNWSIHQISYSSSITVDWSKSDVQFVTLTGSPTIYFSNPREGGKFVLLVKQDSSGNRTVTWGSNIICPLQPNPEPNSLTPFFFLYDSVNAKYVLFNLDSDKLDGKDGSYYLDRANHTGTQLPNTIAPQGHDSGLDADKLDGQEGSYYLDRANHTGIQPPSTISPQGSGSGLDADKLDGYHASQIPVANNIPVSGADGKIDEGWLPEDMNLNSLIVNDKVGIGATTPNSKLHCWGSFATIVHTFSVNTALGANHHIVLVDASVDAITIELPDAATCTGRQYIIKKIDSSSNAVTISAQSGQTIDGQSSMSITTQYGIVRVVSDGSNWYVF